jgi:hypothetical protein
VWCARFGQPAAESAAVVTELGGGAAKLGFQFWLDSLDPTLQMLTPPAGVVASAWLSLATAAVIEMALLNCTDAIVII